MFGLMDGSMADPMVAMMVHCLAYYSDNLMAALMADSKVVQMVY